VSLERLETGERVAERVEGAMKRRSGAGRGPQDRAERSLVDRSVPGKPHDEAIDAKRLEFARTLAQLFQLTRSVAEKIVVLADHDADGQPHRVHDPDHRLERRGQTLPSHLARNFKAVRSSLCRVNRILERTGDDLQDQAAHDLSPFAVQLTRGMKTIFTARVCW
jgi:hypothetical protein